MSYRLIFSTKEESNSKYVMKVSFHTAATESAMLTVLMLSIAEVLSYQPTICNRLSL